VSRAAPARVPAARSEAPAAAPPVQRFATTAPAQAATDLAEACQHLDALLAQHDPLAARVLEHLGASKSQMHELSEVADRHKIIRERAKSSRPARAYRSNDGWRGQKATLSSTTSVIT